MSGFVYIWYDRKHKRYYVGSHWGSEDDGYICSSNWMRTSYKRRPHDFKRRIISRIDTNRKDLLEEEYRYLEMIKEEELKVRYYNLNKKQHNYWWLHEDRRKKTIGEKISQSMTGRTLSPEHIENMRKGRTGVKTGPKTEEHKKKLSESVKGFKHTEEAKQKISAAAKRGNSGQFGKRPPWNKGKKTGPMSAETKKKIADTQKKRLKNL